MMTHRHLEDENPIEHCVLCNKETSYRLKDHIDLREGYVEGCGQFCNKCYKSAAEEESIKIPRRIIVETPNNFELGSLIRKIFFQS